MRPSYSALRLWSAVLIGVGAIGLVLVVTGAIVAMLGVATFAQGPAMFLISGMLGALFAKQPIALGQGLRTRADVAEYVQGQQSRVW
jgi:hypothetical protein